ncbi:sigma-70 family RNA polymerase sigma factor [Longispora sp. NPDC051575]|uniref:RNA polymerase sigma factor n=1 Tax=Longispora sp. NPDC051575 TaxID=3154943 RepID=UPI0034249E9B
MGTIHDGFDELYRQFFPQLVAYLVKIGMGHEAEDAAQETMGLVYLGWDTLDHPTRWAYRVASRTASRALHRRRVGQDKVALSVEGGWCPIADPEPDGVLVKESEQELLDLLRTLPVQQRKVMALHLDGHPDEEIAAILQVRTGTVRSHRRHALNSLRTSFTAAHRPAGEQNEEGSGPEERRS